MSRIVDFVIDFLCGYIVGAFLVSVVASFILNHWQ